MDGLELLLLGGLVYYFYTRSSFASPVSLPVYQPLSPVPNVPSPVIPPYAGVGTVTDPTLIPAQQSINSQIAQFNADLNAGATVATAAVGILASLHVLTAAVAGPIGAAIAGVVILVKSLVSDVHLYANALVNQYENPFGQGVIAIIQQITKEFEGGTLTQTDATNARDAVVAGWALYQAKMHEIQTQGTDWYIVATQSLNNLDNQYMGTTLPNGKTLGVGMGGAFGDTPDYGFMSSWIDWLNRMVLYTGGQS
jgi:hypothetical protein